MSSSPARRIVMSTRTVRRHAGSSRIVLALVRGLSAAGHHVEVVADRLDAGAVQAAGGIARHPLGSAWLQSLAVRLLPRGRVQAIRERAVHRSRPDLVISGMNTGANVGINVIYSGTIAAALEAAFLGIPSIAVSLHMGGGRADFRRAAREARRALDIVLRDGLPDKHACLSINVPRTEIGDDRAVPEGGYPVRVCRMNTHGLNDKYERRTAPSGEVYYWAAGHGLDFRFTDEASDVELLMKRCTTVTPLRYDLTKKSVLEMWRRRVEGK